MDRDDQVSQANDSKCTVAIESKDKQETDNNIQQQDEVQVLTMDDLMTHTDFSNLLLLVRKDDSTQTKFEVTVIEYLALIEIRNSAPAIQSNTTISTQLNMTLDIDTEKLLVNKMMTSLCFHCDELQCSISQLFAKLLNINTTISILDLGNNNIGIDGVKYIAMALYENTSLLDLTLDKNEITDEGIQTLSDMLLMNQTLTKLRLDSNRISQTGAKIIASALCHNTSLSMLELGNNNIEDEGAKCIADMLIVNKSITMLGLTRNNIGPMGATSIASALHNNKVLHHIELTFNDILDEGAMSISEMLLVNKTLKILDVLVTGISNIGAIAIATSLQYNSTLRRLLIFGTAIYQEGVDAIWNTMEDWNDTVRILALPKPIITIFERPCELKMETIYFTVYTLNTRVAPKKMERRRHCIWNDLVRNWIRTKPNKLQQQQHPKKRLRIFP
jgi:Leucine Rich repeat